MLAWGGCGVVGALAAGLIRNRWAFAALCFALGFAFSSAMDLWYWYSFWPHTWEALTLVFARDLVQRLPRGRQRRLRGRHRPRAAPAAGAVRPPAESGGRMGLKLAVIASSALALAAATPADYVASRQQADGGFAEPGARSDSALTAWAVLGLKAAGRPPDGTVVYLRDAPVADTTDLALRVMALRAVGESPEPFLTRLRRQRRSDGRIGSLVNSTIWGVLALPRGERRAVRYLLGASDHPAAGRGPERRAGLQRHRRGDPGAPLERRPWPADPARARLHPQPHRPKRRCPARRRREPDAQSTAWAVQAYLAAGVKPPAAAFRFLASLRRPDGSYRYSRRYAVTPAIVTAQVLPALSRKPFPLR